MARARAADNARSRSKSALIEEISRGIEQFQDVLTSIEDFSREGFPYRDAARAKAELQLRECVRRIFGERSTEYQTYRTHKLRTSNKSETMQSLTVVKQLIHTLEDKKLELQGLKPPPPDPAPPQPPAVTPQMTLVPPLLPLSPTAQVTMAPQPPITAPPLTVSVAMTTNLGVPACPPPVPASPPPAVPVPPEPIAPLPATQAVAQPSPVEPPPQSQAPVAAPRSPEPPAAPPAPATGAPAATEAPSPAMVTSSPSSPAPSSPAPSLPSLTNSELKSPEPAALPQAAPEAPPAPQPSRSFRRAAPEPRVSEPDPLDQQDPLELVRKVCLRFHAVTRQLRLRKDYRTTLEVEDDYDLQDLLCALLRVEFDEVSVEEWNPPYGEGAPRTSFLLHGEQIAVVAKKTRPGLTIKEIADQVAADSAHYSVREKCTTLFCFIYDPEGRIGSPKRLETDLTSVSDRYTIEVLVAPK